ncbi:4a-hydroxytetrahydrobiopterin dehydratase [Pontibacter anaerobius]|uniref:Putative pterin-4-alpha-carbinolamine dehydratase n=1 Tax=Pontibacter anaerobius TaxID=2993940 RepID=A0ABT3RG63_9BACT|nr:4a-hydroxytetrahydrobiopterin dehydratase [Pontibacter anaerobius]MCX2740607.1 4a-hydroxytetrahydrobiopterin dehydratase [Pontibacter anaerobius]
MFLQYRQARPLTVKPMWKEEENKISRSLTFKDFKQALAFMNAVGEVAEELNHHPWWSNVYNKVEIELTTHDASNTVTEKDHELARRIDRIYDRMMAEKG